MTPLHARHGMLGHEWVTRGVPWDPYLLWADFTGTLPDEVADDPQDSGDGGREPMAAVLIQFRDLATFARWVLGPKASVGRPVYIAVSHAGWQGLIERLGNESFACLLLPPGKLRDLVLESTQAHGAGLRRLELSVSRTPTPFLGFERFQMLLEAYFQALKLQSTLELLRNLDSKARPSLRAAPPPPPGARKVVVTVVDDLCNFAAWPRGTIRSIWRQLTRRRRGGARAHGFKALDEYSNPADAPAFYGETRDFHADPIGGSPGPRCDDEIGEYRRARYLHPTTQWSHGSGVLSMLLHREPRPQGVHFVQLPSATVLDTAGGSLASYALDGILYAAERAQREGATHAVVNLSFGTHAGPHDGTSTFERALAQILDLYNGCGGRPELHVVVPIGNAQRLRTHACAQLGARRSFQLRWRVLPDNPAPCFVEIWFSRRDVQATITLTGPDGTQGVVAGGEIVQWVERRDWGIEVSAAQIFARGVSQGDSGTMALLAVGPTNPASYIAKEDVVESESRRERHGRDMGTAAHGVWTVEIELMPGYTEAVLVDAWVQRGDAAPARSPDRHGFEGRQSFFLEEQESDVAPEVTLNGVAALMHPRFHVVGAMRQSDDGLSPYSAAGPARLPSLRTLGPDAVMPVDASSSLHGIVTGGVLSQARIRLTGTSLAAPSYARGLYDWLSATPPRDAIGFKQLAGGQPLQPTQDPPDNGSDSRPAEPLLRGEFQRMAVPPEGPDLEIGLHRWRRSQR